MTHDYALRHLSGWNAWQTTCSCGWESSPWPSRPEAVREHSVHAHALALPVFA